MARSAEKAMTALARWRRAHLDDGKKEPERRPYLATDCDDLPQAEKWRRQIIGEVSRKVAQIQNAGLGEFRIRDLNDEINKLLREKGHWEDRIKELGGPDYKKVGPRMLDHEGKEVPGNRGYKYFGEAKNLPGVKELFESAPAAPPRKTRAELMKYVDADYYGYRDEDDGMIVPLETQLEKEVVAAKISDWRKRKEQSLADTSETNPEAVLTTPIDPDADIYATTSEVQERLAPVETEHKDLLEGQQFIAHVPIPSQKEVEEALVERRKQELLNRYASDVLQAQEGAARQMLGIDDS